MNWLEQFSLLMRSTVTTLEEKVQDPERLLHQLILDMEEELERVRRGVAEALADEIQLRHAAERATQEAAQWLERAQSALNRGDEHQARGALEQKLRCEQRADELSAEHRKQQQQTARLQTAVRDLEDKIRQARQRRTLLQARLLRAQSQQRIERNLSSSQQRSAFAQFERLEQRVQRQEALNEAYARLDGRDPEAEDLEREFLAREQRQRLERELAALKQRLDDVQPD